MYTLHIVLTRFRKTTKSYYKLRHVFLSVRPQGATRLPLHGFSRNLVFEYFPKSVEKIQVSLKSDKNKGYFTWRPMYIYDNISLNSSWNEKCFRQICRENQNIHFMSNNHLFPKQYRLWDNVEKYGTAREATDDNIIRRMRIACWITKATDTLRIAFPRQQWLSQRTSVLRDSTLPVMLCTKNI
jgi:hypothetical protein